MTSQIRGGQPRIVSKLGKLVRRHQWAPRGAQHLVAQLRQLPTGLLSPFFEFRLQFFFSGVRSAGTRSACRGRMSWRLVQNTDIISEKIRTPQLRYLRQDVPPPQIIQYTYPRLANPYSCMYFKLVYYTYAEMNP